MILGENEKKTKKYKLEKEMTNRFMKKRKINDSLRERVYLYLDYLH